MQLAQPLQKTALNGAVVTFNQCDASQQAVRVRVPVCWLWLWLSAPCVHRMQSIVPVVNTAATMAGAAQSYLASTAGWLARGLADSQCIRCSKPTVWTAATRCGSVNI